MAPGLLDAHQLLGLDPAAKAHDQGVDALGGHGLIVALGNHLVGVVAQLPEFLRRLRAVDLVAQPFGGGAVAVEHGIEQSLADGHQVFDAWLLARPWAAAVTDAEQTDDGGDQAGLQTTV